MLKLLKKMKLLRSAAIADQENLATTMMSYDENGRTSVVVHVLVTPSQIEAAGDNGRIPSQDGYFSQGSRK